MRIKAILLCAFLLLGICACKPTDSVSPSEKPNENASPSPNESTEPGESEELGESLSPSENPIPEDTRMILKAEDFYKISSGSSYGHGIRINTADTETEGAEILYHPVFFQEGYKSFGIKYAHGITDYTVMLEVYTLDSLDGGTYTLCGSVELPPTGNNETFSEIMADMTKTVSGRGKAAFFVRTPDNKPQDLCVENFYFGAPEPRVVNTEAIDWDQFKTGRPSLEGKTESNKIDIYGDGDRIIENLIFRPKKDEYAISIHNHREGEIIIRNCVFIGVNDAVEDGFDAGNGQGIYIVNSNNVTVDGNYFENIQFHGIWVQGTWGDPQPMNNIVISNNKFLDMQGQFYAESGWGWDTHGIAFLDVRGTGNRIWYNRFLNSPGKSFMCDWLNIYQSHGEYESPIQVYYNEFFGSGGLGMYNRHGAGIQVGDHSSDEDGGQYIYARYNRMIYPGMVGMNINGGYRNEMSYNWIYSDDAFGPMRYILKEERSDQGVWSALTLFNYSGGPSRDSHHRVVGNRVWFWGQTYSLIKATESTETVIEDNIFTERLYPLDILPYDFMEN